MLEINTRQTIAAHLPSIRTRLDLCLSKVAHLSLQDLHDLWHELPESLDRTRVLETLAYEALKVDAYDVAERVLVVLGDLGQNAPLNLIRTLVVYKARLLDEDVFPTSIPPERWLSNNPHLFQGMYTEWYAGRIECLMGEDVVVRSRYVKRKVDGEVSVKFGTLILKASKIQSFVPSPNVLNPGSFFEAVLDGSEWRLLFHSPEAGVDYTPNFFTS